ncbi:MAG: acylphosphatase [Cyclobacteriaceae bacterium]|nr:acylphosphatase [Cyclobacteriaceae bacterium]MCH8515188.1 acylphosphatase [Cyclobacteriaceae bacterium]
MAEGKIECRSIVVRGKVQGVFFRASTQAKANSFGLKGWVKNNADGSVSIAVEGNQEQVKALEIWCHSGPTNAEVTSLSSEPLEELQGFKSFDIIK